MSKKIHAQRNEKLCHSLNADGEFHDWAVTTAFYSALHYVQHEIFPLEIGRRNYLSFDNYYNSILGKKPSKHQLTIDLVFDNLKESGAKYKWLHDTCINARYHNYNVAKIISDKSVQYLEDIKSSLVK